MVCSCLTFLTVHLCSEAHPCTQSPYLGRTEGGEGERSIHNEQTAHHLGICIQAVSSSGPSSSLNTVKLLLIDRHTVSCMLSLEPTKFLFLIPRKARQVLVKNIFFFLKSLSRTSFYLMYFMT